MHSEPHHITTTDHDVPDAANAVAPSGRVRWRESYLTVLEYLATRLSGDLIACWPRGDEHPVIVIPGFLAGPGSTSLLRSVLERLGYKPHDWGQGWNLGYRPRFLDELPALLTRLHSETGKRGSIIGWSAGGIYAREIARIVPDHVRMVITLGAPFRGNHHATNSWGIYALLNPGSTEIMSEAARIRRENPLSVPTTCIYSKTDGVVAWECCTSLPAARTENVEVHSTHVGYGHNLETLYVIADRLAQPENHWSPYAPSNRVNFQ